MRHPHVVNTTGLRRSRLEGVGEGPVRIAVNGLCAHEAVVANRHDHGDAGCGGSGRDAVHRTPAGLSGNHHGHIAIGLLRGDRRECGVVGRFQGRCGGLRAGAGEFHLRAAHAVVIIHRVDFQRGGDGGERGGRDGHGNFGRRVGRAGRDTHHGDSTGESDDRVAEQEQQRRGGQERTGGIGDFEAHFGGGLRALGLSGDEFDGLGAGVGELEAEFAGAAPGELAGEQLDRERAFSHGGDGGAHVRDGLARVGRDREGERDGRSARREVVITTDHDRDGGLRAAGQRDERGRRVIAAGHAHNKAGVGDRGSGVVAHNDHERVHESALEFGTGGKRERHRGHEQAAFAGFRTAHRGDEIETVAGGVTGVGVGAHGGGNGFVATDGDGRAVDREFEAVDHAAGRGRPRDDRSGSGGHLDDGQRAHGKQGDVGKGGGGFRAVAGGVVANETVVRRRACRAGIDRDES